MGQDGFLRDGNASRYLAADRSPAGRGAETVPTEDRQPAVSSHHLAGFHYQDVKRTDEIVRKVAQPYVSGEKGGAATVEVFDNRLDAHFGNLADWFSDRHPNLAGYRVIADEIVR